MRMNTTMKSDAAHDVIADKLFERVKKEYEEYIAFVKKMSPEKIIDEAYKLTTLHDLYTSLDPGTYDLTTEQLSALFSMEDPLWCLYHEWMRCDFTLMNDMRYVVSCVADENLPENEKQQHCAVKHLHHAVEADCEDEDDLEL